MSLCHLVSYCVSDRSTSNTRYFFSTITYCCLSVISTSIPLFCFWIGANVSVPSSSFLFLPFRTRFQTSVLTSPISRSFFESRFSYFSHLRFLPDTSTPLRFAGNFVQLSLRKIDISLHCTTPTVSPHCTTPVVTNVVPPTPL